MDAKRFAVGCLAGAITVIATGMLVFSLPPFRAFMTYALTAGSATGVARDPQIFWAVALGALSYSALVTLAIGSRPAPMSVGAGVKIGAVVGLLLWATADFMLYGVSNVGNVTSTLVDPLIELVPGAIAGGVIAAVVGRVRPLSV